MMDTDIFETYDRIARLLEETAQQIERVAQAAAKMFPAAAAGPTESSGRITGPGAPYASTERTAGTTNAAAAGGLTERGTRDNTRALQENTDALKKAADAIGRALAESRSGLVMGQ